MKKTPLLHAELSRIIASMGHSDSLVIGDAGLPVPDGVAVIDLALTQGVPPFIQTLRVVLSELQVQEAIVAQELADASHDIYHELQNILPADVVVRSVAHTEFKTLTKRAKAVVRTGEFTPYSNIILVAGVVF